MQNKESEILVFSQRKTWGNTESSLRTIKVLHARNARRFEFFSVFTVGKFRILLRFPCDLRKKTQENVINTEVC